MAEYVKELYSWIAFVPNMTFKNFLEIGIIAFVVYEVLVWIKNTRAWTLLKGILFICGFVLMAAVLELDTILWLLGKASYITITATQPTYIPPVEDVGLVDRDYQADKQYYRPKGKAQMQIYQQILCHHFPDRIMRIYADHQRRVGCRHITPAFLIVDGIPEEIKRLHGRRYQVDNL